MKHPLKWRHSFLRETACWLFGHKWKNSPTRQTQYYGMDQEEVPYSVRKSTGNYMWENVTWWSHKCIRCRKTHRSNFNWPHEVWYKKVWWALKDAFRSATFHFTFYLWKNENNGGEVYSTKPFIVRLVLSIVQSIASFIKQFLIHFDNLPWTWWTPFADLEWLISCYLEDIKK